MAKTIEKHDDTVEKKPSRRSKAEDRREEKRLALKSIRARVAEIARAALLERTSARRGEIKKLLMKIWETHPLTIPAAAYEFKVSESSLWGWLADDEVFREAHQTAIKARAGREDELSDSIAAGEHPREVGMDQLSMLQMKYRIRHASQLKLSGSGPDGEILIIHAKGMSAPDKPPD